MPVETAQMLATARALHGDLPEDSPYVTLRMRRHPCSEWVTESREGYAYAESLLEHLGVEYTYRYGKIHASVAWYFSLPSYTPPEGRQMPVPLAVKEAPRWEGEPVRTYRNFYKLDKARFATWPDAPPPWWDARPIHNTLWEEL